MRELQIIPAVKQASCLPLLVPFVLVLTPAPLGGIGRSVPRRQFMSTQVQLRDAGLIESSTVCLVRGELKTTCSREISAATLGRKNNGSKMSLFLIRA